MIGSGTPRNINRIDRTAGLQLAFSGSVSSPKRRPNAGWQRLFRPGPARQPPGIGICSMTSTDSPGKIAKCGWFSNIRAAASWDSARTTM